MRSVCGNISRCDSGSASYAVRIPTQMQAGNILSPVCISTTVTTRLFEKSATAQTAVKSSVFVITEGNDTMQQYGLLQ